MVLEVLVLVMVMCRGIGVVDIAGVDGVVRGCVDGADSAGGTGSGTVLVIWLCCWCWR